MDDLDLPDHGERLYRVHGDQQIARSDCRGEEKSGDLLHQCLGKIKTGGHQMKNIYYVLSTLNVILSM